MMNEKDLYLPNGYLDMGKILDYGKPFIFITGGRGTGKTFGAIREIYRRKLKFAFLRRTETQAEIAGSAAFNPFIAINRVEGSTMHPFPLVKKLRGIYETEIDEEGKKHACGEMLGFVGALSTFSNLRGFDASNVDIMILDEFCPEKHERPIRDEGAVFENVYESINRNRELEGRPPLICLCLANSNDLASPILESRGLERIMDRMGKNGKQIYESETTLCIRLKDSPISARKAETAQYKTSQNEEFKRMSLNNEYVASYEENRREKYNLDEYIPMLHVANLAIYRHKSRREFLCSLVKKGTPQDIYTENGGDLEQMLYKYRYLKNVYLQGNMFFSEAAAQIRFFKYFAIKK